MRKLSQLLLAAATCLAATSARADVINFISMTESAGGYGEGAWAPLTLAVGGVNMTITGHATDDDDSQQYAYLDWGNAGLGSCKDAVNLAAVNATHSGSGSNNCRPSSDDNITTNEYLRFVFDHDVIINNLWFNNNHDGGFGAGDQVRIDGDLFNVATGYAGGANGIGSFFVAAGSYFHVAFANEQFYLSGMEVTAAVPEPEALLLLGIGGLMMLQRRRRAV